MVAEEPAPKKARSTAGREEAKAAAEMTSDEWKKLQEGMAEKWPPPEYMKVASDKSKTSYRDETYALVTRWMEETRISYRPHAKAPGSKSHLRYEGYSKATTVGEALELGTFPGDWCWDYERGYIQVHGPVREEPIDVSKVTDESTLTKVDNIINRWYRRELAKILELRYEDLFVGKGSGESTIMRAHRLVAQREASKRLAEAAKEGRRIRDEEVERTLQEWAFARNPNRVNVMRDDQTWVWSDTLGLLVDRIGDIHVTSSTLRYPAVAHLINKWLRDRLPPEVAKFGWTSLNLNCNYAAQRHRDGNNFGPSMITAFGEFKGGELNYFPEDDKSSKLEELPNDKKVPFQLRDGLAMFNGNCAHEVEDFQGERFSVVYFAMGCHAKAPEETRAQLEELGFCIPSTDADRHSLLRPPRGYDASGKPNEAQHGDANELPEKRFWSSKDLEGRPFVARQMPAVPAPAGMVPKSAGTGGKKAVASSERPPTDEALATEPTPAAASQPPSEKETKPKAQDSKSKPAIVKPPKSASASKGIVTKWADASTAPETVPEPATEESSARGRGRPKGKAKASARTAPPKPEAPEAPAAPKAQQIPVAPKATKEVGKEEASRNAACHGGVLAPAEAKTVDTAAIPKAKAKGALKSTAPRPSVENKGSTQDPGKKQAGGRQGVKRPATPKSIEEATPEKSARQQKEDPPSQGKNVAVKPQSSDSQIALTESTLQEAEKLGLRLALQNLSKRSEVQGKGFDGKRLLEVLKVSSAQLLQ